MNKWTCNNCDDGPCFVETRNDNNIIPTACVRAFRGAPWVPCSTTRPTPETLSRTLDAACEELAEKLGCMTSTDCPWLDDHSVDCADCWRQYLLAKAEQERDEG